MKERELSLVDLIVEILLSWRSVIVWMLIGGVLLGGFSYMNSARTANAQKAALEQQQAQQKESLENRDEIVEKLEGKLTKVQRYNVQKVRGYEEMKAFCNDSLYLQMDAAKLPKAELSYLVKVSGSEDAYRIERLYEDTLDSGLQQWLADKGLVEKLGNVNELVSLKRGTYEVQSDSFCVQVIHVTEEQCKELVQQVMDYIASQQDLIAKQAGKHELVLVTQGFAFVRDEEVLDLQRTLWNNITDIDAIMNEAVKKFSEDEKAYYEFLSQMEQEEKEAAKPSVDGRSVQEEIQEIKVSAPGVSIEYVVLGMIIFAFLDVFYLFLKYIMNNKLRAHDDISEMYGVVQLGRIPDEIAKKKLFGFVDRLILKLRDRNRRVFSNEEALGLAGAAVKMAAKKEALEGICCIGCDMNGSALKAAEAIKKTLEDSGIEMTVLNNVLYDLSAMEHLQDVKGAFLLEKAGETLHEEITKELELLKRQEIKVLGVIVVE